MVSSLFNRKFHATLGDILDSNKMIEISNGSITVLLDTKKLDINALKLMFKVLDSDYPKTTKKLKNKTKISSDKLDKLYAVCGIPKSITEITQEELSSHMLWIQSMCVDNNIKIYDSVWDALLEKAEKYGY